ncbi:MAG TPA: LysR substrate-binding domain-containing protein [Acetobacteraceae bacterium]|nr:LysR substrate-binding domain-containing protein [Acetobacteraceae bacterium]
MTLEQLRIFVAVAEREHLTEGARALNRTQSAVSAAVRALERQHATQLFHRVGRGIALTEAGRVFLAEARAVLGRAAAAERTLSELAGLKRGRLTLEASQTIAGYWLPERLVRFRAAFPEVTLAVRIGNTSQVARAVAEGAAELGLVEGAVDDPRLASETVAHDRLVVVVAPGHPWAAGRALRAADLPGTGWVMREPGSGTRSVFEAAIAAEGIAPASLPVALELPSNEAVRGAVEAGAGASAISERVVAQALATGTLARAGFPLPARAYNVLIHRERFPSRAVEALRAILRTPAGKPAGVPHSAQEREHVVRSPAMRPGPE